MLKDASILKEKISSLLTLKVKEERDGSPCLLMFKNSTKRLLGKILLNSMLINKKLGGMHIKLNKLNLKTMFGLLNSEITKTLIKSEEEFTELKVIKLKF
jgi:hypothetical protein